MSAKTRVVARNRTHYARSEGDSMIVRIEDSIAIDLELPASYARDLLVDLRHVIGEGENYEAAQIALDVPFRLHLTPIQAEQFAAKLAKAKR